MSKAGEKFQIKIDSILGGISPNAYEGGINQFQASIGIDPDLSLSGNDIKTSGAMIPSSYSKFSSSGLSGYPRWLTIGSSGAVSTLYAYTSDGELIEYSSALTSASENVIGIPTSGEGNGLAFYNNFIYCATTSSVARFGPLSSAGPVFNNDWWGNEAAEASLQNPTYPGNRSVILPNHPMHVHNDGILYFGDYDSGSSNATYRGKGLIHYIKTEFSTDEGRADSGSTYGALKLPFGYAPVAIASWGTDLAIAAIPIGSDSVLVQGKAKIFLWDTIVGNNYYRAIELPDPICSALLNANGNLFIWSGTMNNGVRVSVYTGGYSIKQVAFFEEGNPPSAAAVDALANRIVWGAYTTFPDNSVSVYSLGYKDANLPLALHNIVNTTATVPATGMVSALKYAQQASFITPRLVVGWRDGSANYGIDKLSNTYGTAFWRSLQYKIGQRFKITKIMLPLGTAVGAGMTLAVDIYVDDASSNTTLTTINSTNYPNSDRRVIITDQQVEGKNNFSLQLKWTGTSLLPVTLPITVEGEYLDDATG